MEPASPETRSSTIEEYLRLEVVSDEKHEFRDGQIVSMAGNTAEHSLITANLIGEFRNQLKGKPCRVYDSNLCVRIARTVLYTYPDALVVCGELQFDPKDANHTTITNPKVIVEVLSPSTETYDRGEKFQQYLRLDSVQEFVLVSQRSARVEVFLRQEGGTWLFSYFDGLESSLHLRSIGVKLPLSEIYAGIEFPPAPAAKTE